MYVIFQLILYNFKSINILNTVLISISINKNYNYININKIFIKYLWVPVSSDCFTRYMYPAVGSS